MSHAGTSSETAHGIGDETDIEQQPAGSEAIAEGPDSAATALGLAHKRQDQCRIRRKTGYRYGRAD